MVKIKDLEELITDEKLDILYEIRNEDLNIMTKDERKKREEILGKNRISFDEVLAKVKNIHSVIFNLKNTILKTTINAIIN